MSTFNRDGADDTSRGQASHRPAPRPGDAQPEQSLERHKEEGKEGSKETLGPDGFLVIENQSAQQSDSSGGLITNRPPYKTNTGGEDWLEVSLYLRHKDFETLASVLNNAREAAEDGREGEDVVTFGGVRFLVRPCGASAGGGPKTVYFRWQLQSENGLIFQLMNREEPHRTMPNGNFRVTSLLLMKFGADRLWQEAMRLLDAMGCALVANKLSRVDPCVDIPEMSIGTLCMPFSAGNYVALARVRRTYDVEAHVVEGCSAAHSLGREFTGFVVGRVHTKLRVYDKVRELGSDTEKLAAIVGCRWGCWTPKAIRAEFQLRRQSLKSFGVDSVADWFLKRGEVCKYLCTEWFRLVEGPVDRNHADRSPTLSEWTLIEQAFAGWTGEVDYICLEPLKTEECLPTHLLQQVVGLLVSYSARTGAKFGSTAEFVETLSGKILRLIGKRDIPAAIERKVFELGLMPTAFKEFENGRS